MKKYLVFLKEDVADEGDVGLIEIIDENELNKTKSYSTGFGNIDGDTYPFSKSYAKEITDDEIKVLEKFGLTNLSFGCCFLSEEECDDDDYDNDDEEDDD